MGGMPGMPGGEGLEEEEGDDEDDMPALEGEEEGAAKAEPAAKST